MPIGNEHLTYRVLLVAALLAIKSLEDDVYPNSHYCKVGGISLQDLNRLEYEFLGRIDFRVCVSEKLFKKYNDFLNCFIEML